MKFQKSCLPEKFTQDALTQPYVGPNAWAPTYGAHKEHLEFTVDQFAELQHFAEAHVGIMFTASAMDAVSLQQLNRLNVPFIKIGSGDANNIPLLEEAARLQRPLVISTGMQSERMIARIVSIMETAQQPTTQRDYALLHCVSAYPTMATDSRLLRMTQLQQHFGDVCVVGYSGHESGIGVTLASVVLGAKVIWDFQSVNIRRVYKNLSTNHFTDCRTTLYIGSQSTRNRSSNISDAMRFKDTRRKDTLHR